MTKKTLRFNVYLIILILSIILVGYVFLAFKHPIIFDKLVKLLPLLLSLPATYLAYCFQQRLSHVKDLRKLAYNILNAVKNAQKYTYIEKPIGNEHIELLTELSRVIDECRMFYKNIGQTKNDIGLYPFEPIKEIFEIVKNLGTASSPEQRQQSRINITQKWKELWKDEFLYVFAHRFTRF